MMNSAKSQFRAVKGFTLIELLVGVSLGLILIGAVIQIYLSTRATYETTENLNRAQEDLRFAAHFISRDLRETSNLDCLRNVRDISDNVSEVSSLNIRLGGWNYDGTSANDTFEQPANYEIDDSANSWDGLNDGVSTGLPAAIESVALSDVLAIKSIELINDVLVSQTISGVSGSMPGLASVAIAGYSPQVGESLIVGDCFTASRFMVGQVNGNEPAEVFPISGRQFLRNFDESSSVYSVFNTYYYVGLRNGATVPSLFRLRTLPGAQPEELVEGVENMQLAFGIDTTGNNFANQYVAAEDVTDWTQVANVRIGLSLIIPNGRNRSPVTEDEMFTLTDNITLDPIDDDATLRFVSNTTMRTRNLGLFQNHDVCLASDPSPQNVTCNTIGFVESNSSTAPDPI